MTEMKTNAELADEIERHPVTLRLPHTCKPNSLEVDIDGRALTPAESRQIIAALRQPSSNQVLVPREPTQAMMEAAKPAFKQIDAWCAEMQLARGRKAEWSDDDPPLKQAWRAMLSAAEAEGRHE